MTDNPYASPETSDPLADPDPDSFAAIRHAHLNHEASVKSIGMLYFLGAIILIPTGIIIVVGVLLGRIQEDAPTPQRALFMTILIGMIGGFYLVSGIVQLVAGIGLRQLKTWARWTSVALSCIGILAFPIGTLICAYFLYLLLSEKGSVVFSSEYQKVIEATPDIHYKTSRLVIALLILLVLLCGFGVVALIVDAAI